VIDKTPEDVDPGRYTQPLLFVLHIRGLLGLFVKQHIPLPFAGVALALHAVPLGPQKVPPVPSLGTGV
jgi:hypothetical protein